MNKPFYKPLIRYTSFTNTITFPKKLAAGIIPDFAGALSEWQKRNKYTTLTLDFSEVVSPYPNGMIPIIATVANLREKNTPLKILLPRNADARKLFRQNNWAYYLDNKFEKSESKHDRHLVTRSFKDYHDVGWITKDFMDALIRSMNLSRDVFTAMEWSINEICDNVINHSESKIGGFVQLVAFTKQQHISFSVADAGRGILKSLKEGIPTLRTDAQAIGEAIKAGVTRNKQAGQGNGLAGTLRIATLTNGSLEIVSGLGRFYATKDGTIVNDSQKHQYFVGTGVSGLIKLSPTFSINEALQFEGYPPYVSVNYMDLNYETEGGDCLQLIMKNETTGIGTRGAGRQLRTKVLNLLQAKPNYVLHIDWSGIPVISSSFADEFLGKLFLELKPTTYNALIRHNNMELLVMQLIDKAIMQRMKEGIV